MTTQTSHPVPASEQQEAQERSSLLELRGQVKDMQEAAYTYGEYDKEAVRIALDGVIDAIDELMTAEQPQEPAATVQPVAWPLGFKVRHVEGHGWIIEPPHGSRWVAFDGTPAGDFMHAMTAASQPQAAQTEREAEISKKALDAILWMYRRLKPTTGELQFIEDAIRALSHQPAQADGQKGGEA